MRLEINGADKKLAAASGILLGGFGVKVYLGYTTEGIIQIVTLLYLWRRLHRRPGRRYYLSNEIR